MNDDIWPGCDGGIEFCGSRVKADLNRQAKFAVVSTNPAFERGKSYLSLPIRFEALAKTGELLLRIVALGTILNADTETNFGNIVPVVITGSLRRRVVKPT